MPEVPHLESASETAEPPLHGGYLVVCAGCSRIKVREEVWTKVAQSVLRSNGHRLSHGLCPECLRTLYPELNLFR